MSGPRILFLPDFGAEIGGGHVMRCLTVAGELKRRGATCAFAVNPEAAAVVRTFGEGMELAPPDWQADIAVADGYDYTMEDEQRLLQRGPKLAVFDDIKRAHDCDLVIDSGLGRTAEDYPGRAKVLTGPSYAPVRPEFVAVREAALKRRGGTGEGRVLVSLGLTDLDAITARVLGLLSNAPGWQAMDVVVGSNAPSADTVRMIAAADPRITIHSESRDMAGLMTRADFAVGAGGSSQWERSVVGLPTLLLILAPNQAMTARQLAELGATLTIDAEGPQFNTLFSLEFTRLASDADLRKSLSDRSASIFDGNGAARVADAILELV